MTQNNTAIDTCTATDLSNYTVVILTHDDLSTFISTIGGVSELPDGITLFTDDEVTQNTVEFNLITYDIDDGTYGIATQLHHPFTSDDTVLDLRENVNASFAEYLLGLL